MRVYRRLAAECPGRWIAIATVVLCAAPSRADIGGTYQSALGKIKITESDERIIGKLVGKSPCGFKRGTVVLRGDRLDDSITGDVKVCKTGPGCKGSMNGLAMLLVTRSGSVISGYVHSESGSCKTPLDQSAISFKRNKGRAGSQGSQARSNKSASPKDPKANAGSGSSGDASSTTHTPSTPGQGEKKTNDTRSERSNEFWRVRRKPTSSPT